MELGLTEEQEIIKSTARNFLARECPKTLVKELDNSEEGYSPDLWRKMAEIGYLGLAFPEEYGGGSGTFLDLAILLEQMGYNILPGPFFSTVVLGGFPILMAGTEEQKKGFLPEIAKGNMILTMALTEPNVGYEASDITVKVSPCSNEYIISGTKLFVPNANVADYLLCVARTTKATNPEDGITIFLIDANNPGIKTTLLKTLACDKECEVCFDNVKVQKENILGGLDRGWAIVKDILGKAAVAKCAEMLGGAQAVLDMSIDYAKQRVQFNHPIGSFQAIQHYCANMATDVDGARYITYKAAWSVAEDLPATKDIATAKAWVSDASKRVTMLGHQIFGGIGFTMDHDLHLYYRRAKAGAQAFGDSDFQREIVAKELGL